MVCCVSTTQLKKAPTNPGAYSGAACGARSGGAPGEAAKGDGAFGDAAGVGPKAEGGGPDWASAQHGTDHQRKTGEQRGSDGPSHG